MALDVFPRDQGTLFLTDEKGRKPVEPSKLAFRSISKAPPNLAIYDGEGANAQLHPVVQHVMDLVRRSKSNYMMQWTSMQQKWNQADRFYWMNQNEADQSELTRAQVSASVYYRVIRRLADGAYLATFTDDMPMKFSPDIGIFESSDTKKKKALVAETLNKWANYCMKRTDLKKKAHKSYHQVFKYANHIVYTPYDFKIEKRKRWVDQNVNVPTAAADGTTVYEHADTGQISAQPHPPVMTEQEYDYVTEDHVGYHPLPIEDCYLDNRIEDLDRQTCFLWRSNMTRPEIWAEARAGKFQNVELITRLQKFQLYDWESQITNQRINNADKVTTDSIDTEIYERWQTWILLPKIIVKTNKKGEVTDLEWDQNGEERRYVVESIGELDNPTIVVRFSESPYWSNGIPFIAGHSHEDDSGFYHRGNQELLEDNMIQEKTAKGQLMDNRTLLTFRPLVRLQGRVKNKDMKITHNTVFDVTSMDAIKQLEVSDITGNIDQSLKYLANESEQIAQTPPFMLGEGLGSRTSATEFAAVRDQSSAPALNDIRVLNEQLVGGYMKKLKEYAPQFFDHDIRVPDNINGEQGKEAFVVITAEDFSMDMTLDDVAVQDFENKATMRTLILNLSQFLMSPAVAPFINMSGYLMRLFKSYGSVFPNPEELMNSNPQAIAMIQQYLAQRPPEGGPAAVAGIPMGAPGGPQMPELGGGAPTQAQAANAVTGYAEGQAQAAAGGQAGGL